MKATDLILALLAGFCVGIAFGLAWVADQRQPRCVAANAFHDTAMSNFVLGMLCGGAILCALTVSIDNAVWKDDAVKHKAAEYYLDGSTAQWRWLQ